MRLAAAMAAAVLAGAATAQDAGPLAPGSAPVPLARPTPPDVEPRPSEDAVPLVDEEPPIEGTSDAAGATVGRLIPPEEMPPLAPPPVPIREELAETDEELAACLADLESLGVEFGRAEPRLDPADPDCGIANPILVASIRGVAVEPPAELRCDAARAAGRWMAGTVLPASRRLEARGPLAGIVQGTGYLCRPRVGDEPATLSEHAFGNALDVAAFRFEEGEPLAVAGLVGQGSLDEAFLAAVRGGACLDFTTVLGPGDPEHEDHLHLDVRAREGAFRICQ